MADKPDSHDVCFIADGDTRNFLRGQLGARPGRDRGRRRGGRRHAMTGATASPSASARAWALTGPAADGRPRYVLDIEPVSNTVTVGSAEDLDVLEIEASQPGLVGLRRP